MSGAVTIRRCASAEEAAIVCSLLSDAGIPASLDNWYHATTDWALLPALGGVGVLIPASSRCQALQAMSDYANTARERLCAEFADIDFEPIRTDRARKLITLLIQTCLVYFFITLIVVSLDIAFPHARLSNVDGFYNYIYSTLDFRRADWLVYSMSSLIYLSPVLVPLSIFVFLARRFLNKRARQKQPT